MRRGGGGGKVVGGRGAYNSKEGFCGKGRVSWQGALNTRGFEN